MGKTPEQLITNYVSHAERSDRAFETARSSRDSELLAFNLQQSFKARLMQGLLRWRLGIGSPAPALLESVETINEGLTVLESAGTKGKISSVNVERAWIVGCLLDATVASFDESNLKADRLLDAILAKRLLGLRAGLWDTGMEQLKALEGTEL